MNSIQKVNFGYSYSQKPNRQSDTKVSTPAFKGANDVLIKQMPMEKKGVAALCAAILAPIVIGKLGSKPREAGPSTSDAQSLPEASMIAITALERIKSDTVKTWEEFFTKIETVIEENEQLIADAEDKADTTEEAARADLNMALTAAKDEYNKKYYSLCMETMGKECDDVVNEAYCLYIDPYEDRKAIAAAYRKYIDTGYGCDSVISRAYKKYIDPEYNCGSVIAEAYIKHIDPSYASGSAVFEAKEKLKTGEITDAEYATVEQEALEKYNEIKKKAQADYDSISRKAYADYNTVKCSYKEKYELLDSVPEIVYESMKSDDETRYNAIKTKFDGIKQEYEAAVKNAREKYYFVTDSAKQEWDALAQSAERENSDLRTILNETRTLKTGSVGSPITVAYGVKLLKKEYERNIRLQKRAEAAQQAKALEQEKRQAEKFSKKVAELERKGFVNIKVIDDKTISFIYQGVNYVLTNNSSHDLNFYKILTKSHSGEMIPDDLTLKAIVDQKEYDCDWWFGESTIVTEKMCEFLEENETQLSNPYFKNVLEEYVKYMTMDELDDLTSLHKSISLATQRGSKYVNSLKVYNPQKYIEIITPIELCKTEEGQAFLYKYAPDLYFRTLSQSAAHN